MEILLCSNSETAKAEFLAAFNQSNSSTYEIKTKYYSMTAKLVTVSLDQIKPATAVVILTSNVEEVELVRAKVSGEDLMSE